MDFIELRKRKIGKGCRAALMVARMPARRLPLASFFPALGSKHSVMLLGFPKHCLLQEFVVSIDESYLRFHPFYPLRESGPIIGDEMQRFKHAENLLASYLIAFIATNIIATVVLIDGETIIRTFRDGILVNLLQHEGTTLDHALYRTDYCESESLFAFTYRLSQSSIIIISDAFLDVDSPSTTLSHFGRKYLSCLRQEARHIGRRVVMSTTFDALQFTRMYILDEYPSSSIIGSPYIVTGPMFDCLRQLIIIIYVPIGNRSDKKISHLLLFVNINTDSADICVTSILNADSIMTGSHKLEFAGYCTARGLKRVHPCVALYCRDKLCEEDPGYVLKEAYCTSLSNFFKKNAWSSSTSSESWLYEIEHPVLPIVVYNDEVNRANDSPYSSEW